MIKFRDLKKDEIEIRIGTAKANGITLLLYKDARADMDILDETVGPENWCRDHKELKGNIYCGISIFCEDKKQWITKWDCGSESNTEKEKGEASDSFKRSAVNWGIGRELYTSPFIWISSENCKIEEGNNKNYKCYDKFKVKEITIENKIIKDLVIINAKTDKVVFTTKNMVEDIDNKLISETEGQSLVKLIQDKQLDKNNKFLDIYKKYGYSKTNMIKQKDFMKIKNELEEII